MNRVNLLRIASFMAYFGLIGSMSALVMEIPVYTLVIFVAAFLVGLIQDKKFSRLPLFNSITMTVFVILGTIYFLAGINPENLLERFISILVVILSAKLLSPKKARDLLQIYLLNFLMVAASAVVRWGMEFGLLLLVETLISVTGLIFIYGSYEHQDIPKHQAWQLFRWSVLITIALIPVTAFFFLILPRPSWTIFAWTSGAAVTTGFSDQVSPGTVEQIKVDDSPAFRVKWLRGIPPLTPLWRGIVYDSYWQGVWHKRYKHRVFAPKRKADKMAYEVLLEPNSSSYLLSLSLPARVTVKDLKASLVAGYTIYVPKLIFKRTLYQVESYQVSDFPEDIDHRYYLEILENLRGELLEFARQFEKKTHFETAQAIEQYLKKNFKYNLSPGKPEGEPVLYFLFKGKEGHCEYFASSMTLMLRSLNIPARVVGGFLGGQWNEMGRYYLVRNSDAHTWVEVWIKERGWVTFDPTPQSVDPHKFLLVTEISRFIDYMKLKWYYWVVDYDLSRQKELIQKTATFMHSLSLNRKVKLSVKKEHVKVLLPVALVVVILILLKTGWTYWKSRPKTWGEWFVYTFKNYGYHMEKGETLQEFALRITKTNPHIGHKALEFVRQYYLMEYGQSGQDRGFHPLLRQIRLMLKKK